MRHDPRYNPDFTRRVAAVSDILRRHDPACIGDDMPEDEYDPEAVAVVVRGKDVATPGELGVLIANVLAEQFDQWTGSQSLRDTDLALNIWAVLHPSTP